MKILMISGSRNTNGMTARAANALLEGAEKAGATVERVFLPLLDIQRCRQCTDNGWGVCFKETRCVINDDFAMVVDKIKAADAVVFANPVYMSNLAESLRAFGDRLCRIGFQKAKAGQGKPTIGICVAGGGGGGAPECCYHLERMTWGGGFDVVDMIPVRRQNLEFKLPLLRQTGAWLATGPSSGS